LAKAVALAIAAVISVRRSSIGNFPWKILVEQNERRP
jgi:hypothetical protein